MFYFLVFLIPFLSVMAYLIITNNRLKETYEAIVEQLYQVRKDAQLEDVLFPIGIKHNMIVTDNAIKRLEKFIMALEEPLDMKKGQSISNAYKPKQEKLTILSNRASQLAQKINTSVENEVVN